MVEQASEQATPNRILGCSRLNIFSTSDEQETTCSQKRRKPAKSIPKKKRQHLLKSLRSVELNNLRAEIRMAVEEQFADSNLCEFINELFKEEEPMMEIVRQHRDNFVLLYGECKRQKNSFMRFQLQWHYHCSAFLLAPLFNTEYAPEHP